MSAVVTYLVATLHPFAVLGLGLFLGFVAGIATAAYIDTRRVPA